MGQKLMTLAVAREEQHLLTEVVALGDYRRRGTKRRRYLVSRRYGKTV